MAFVQVRALETRGRPWVLYVFDARRIMGRPHVPTLLIHIWCGPAGGRWPAGPRSALVIACSRPWRNGLLVTMGSRKVFGGHFRDAVDAEFMGSRCQCLSHCGDCAVASLRVVEACDGGLPALHGCCSLGDLTRCGEDQLDVW